MLTILIHSTDETISQKQFYISVIVIETGIGDVFRESQILLVILERISSTKLDTFVEGIESADEICLIMVC